jgi:hypothetical protein
LTGNFYYTSITLIELFAGQTYVLDGFTSVIDDDGTSGTNPYGVITATNEGADGFGTGLPITILGDNIGSNAVLADTGTTTPNYE